MSNEVRKHRLGDPIGPEMMVRIKSYLECGLSAPKVEKITGVPADTIYKLKRGYWGDFKAIQSDPELKKEWNQKRKAIIDAAYNKAEAIVESISEVKINSANLKDTVEAAVKLLTGINNMMGTSKSTTEVSEEMAFIKGMKETELDGFIAKTSNALGIEDANAVMLRRKVTTTVEESQTSSSVTDAGNTGHIDNGGQPPIISTAPVPGRSRDIGSIGTDHAGAGEPADMDGRGPEPVHTEQADESERAGQATGETRLSTRLTRKTAP